MVQIGNGTDVTTGTTGTAGPSRPRSPIGPRLLSGGNMLLQDRMLVCRAGHLITDRLTTRPDLRLPRCDRCGADTLDRCDTCGTLLAGARPSDGLDPIGSRPPRVCTTCRSPFPWAKLDDPPGDEAIEKLEHLLRRLPRVVRELRPAPDLDTLV